MTKTVSATLKDTVFGLIPDVVMMRKVTKMRLVLMYSFAIFFLVLGFTMFMWEAECKFGNCDVPLDLDAMHMTGLVMVTLSCIMLFYCSLGKMMNTA